jgi:hypothetical protein
MTRILFALLLVVCVTANENATDRPTLSFKPKSHQNRRTHPHAVANETKKSPDVDFNTIGEVIMASVIPEAIHTIAEAKTMNKTILTPVELIISQLSLPKRRASDMLCDVTWETKARKKVLRCRDLDLNSIVFDDKECDSITGDCTRYL